MTQNHQALLKIFYQNVWVWKCKSKIFFVHDMNKICLLKLKCLSSQVGQATCKIIRINSETGVCKLLTIARIITYSIS